MGWRDWIHALALPFMVPPPAPPWRVSKHERIVYGADEPGWRCGWCSDPRRHVHEFNVMPRTEALAANIMADEPPLCAPGRPDLDG